MKLEINAALLEIIRHHIVITTNVLREVSGVYTLVLLTCVLLYKSIVIVLLK